MRGRLMAGILVGTLLIVSCSTSKSARPSGAATSSTARKAPTTYASAAQLVSAIRTQGLTPQRAELYFSLMFGDLPGVSTKGIAPDADDFDGTTATDDIEREWSSLSSAQRQAVAKALKGRTLPASAAPAESLATFMASGTTPTTATTKSARRGPQPTYRLAAATEAFTDEQYVDGANAAMAAVAGQLGQPPIPVKVVYNNDPDSGPNGNPYAETHLYSEPWYAFTQPRWPDGCHITVFDQGHKMQAIAGDLTELASVLVHESTHCFQQQTAGSLAAWNTTPDWLSEGEATWAMAQLVPEATVYIKYWTKYLSTPKVAYVDRAYDGIGLFGHEGDLTSQDSIWPKLMPMESARVGEGGSDTAAWNILLGSGSDRYYSTWGGSWFLDDTNNDWNMQDPGQIPSTAPAPTSVTIGNDEGQQLATDASAPYQASQTTIQGDADILIITLASGYGEVHDQNFGVSATLDDMQPLKLCLKSGGCKCPDGSAGASAFTQQATRPISVGLDGGDHSLAAYAAGLSLDQFCKQPDPQPPTDPGQPPGGGGGGGGGEPPDTKKPNGISEGDPHLTTYDGASFDLQVAGELVMSKSTTDDLQVQARLVPLTGSSAVAVNQSVAAEVDGHRVTLSLENGSIVARLDGTQLVQPNNAAGAGTVDRQGTTAVVQWVVEWPDGTRLEVGQLGLAGLNIQMWPAAHRAGKLVGVLGNDNGKTSDDLALADGTTLHTPDDHTLDTTYADSWRVTQATSLFDYGPGQTTDTFTDKTFPQGPQSIPDRAAITKQCQADGITDRYLLADCVVDASAIQDPAGSQAVLGHYAQAQTVRTIRYDLARHVKPFKAPASTGSSSTPTTAGATTGTASGAALQILVDSGRVAATTESPSFSFPAKAGDVIWIGPPGCDSSMTVALKDPSGKVLDADDVSLGLPGCQIGRFALTKSGTYQLVINADHKGTGSYGIPIRFEDPDATSSTSYGKTVSGSIPMTAAHHVYKFNAHAGDTVHISGSGCNLGFAHPVVVGQEDDVQIATSSGKGLFILGCEKSSTFQIPQSGNYEAVVNYANVGPFSYHFELQK